MICPKCGHTISEQERYLMAREPDGDMVWTPALRTAAVCVILFLILVGLLVIARQHGLQLP